MLTELRYYEVAIVKVCEILFRSNNPASTVPGAEMPTIKRFRYNDMFTVRLPKGKSPIKVEITALPEVCALDERLEYIEPPDSLLRMPEEAPPPLLGYVQVQGLKGGESISRST